MKNVLQPSDATIDSRLLVSASDLTLKKATQLVLGEDSSGVDVDEFVSKCITLMRYGAPTTEADGPPPSSRRPRASGRRSTTNQDDSEDEDEDDGNDGDAFDWALLGEKGCIPYNCRPPVRSFLLGPLSVRKKVRASQPRRPRLVADDRQAVSKPEELKTSDLTQNASSNLSAVCSKIHRRLKQVIEDGQRSVETEASDAISEIELSALMRKHHVTKELAVPLFDFAINPTSFGQTVENLFYISFLIREGKISIEKNEAGLPTVRKLFSPPPYFLPCRSWHFAGRDALLHPFPAESLY